MENENNTSSGRTAIVGTVANKCRPAEADSDAIATTVAKRPHTGPDRVSVTAVVTPPVTAAVTSTNTRRNRTAIVTAKICENCGRGYGTSRPTRSRFCTTSCRRRAWLVANPERARELAAADKERLKQHMLKNGFKWIEAGHNEGGTK